MKRKCERERERERERVTMGKENSTVIFDVGNKSYSG
jgi:hypothetical protein